MKSINEVKEFFKDPKKKALTQLGLYGIFFIFVFILINISEKSVNTNRFEETKTPIEYYKDMISYDYKVTYTNIDKIDVIEGTYYNGVSLFNYNNLKYYYEDMLYVINNDSYSLSTIEYNISKIFNKNLNVLFDKLIEESKTTYKDGTIISSYTLDSNIIYNYLYEVDSYYSNLVNVNVKEEENIITSIVFDLTNLGLNLNKIEIEYNNFNNIENLEFNKNIYTYEENL